MDELSLTIYDIVENSIRANASLIYVRIIEDSLKNNMDIVIEDDGKGMSPSELARAIDPFYTTKKVRKVGLGLSLFKMMAEQTEGKFEIESKKKKGTTVRVTLTKDHIDRPPLGDLAEMIYSIIVNPEVKEFIYEHHLDGKSFVFKKSDLEMETEIIADGSMSKAIKEYLNFNLNIIGRGE